MSARTGAGVAGREPVETSLMKTAARASALDLDSEPEASLALTPAEEAELQRAAYVGDVLVRLLDADVTNNSLLDGETFDDRQRGALLACVGYAFGRVEDVLGALERRRDGALRARPSQGPEGKT